MLFFPPKISLLFNSLNWRRWLVSTHCPREGCSWEPTFVKSQGGKTIQMQTKWFGQKHRGKRTKVMRQRQSEVLGQRGVCSGLPRQTSRHVVNRGRQSIPRPWIWCWNSQRASGPVWSGWQTSGNRWLDDQLTTHKHTHTGVFSQVLELCGTIFQVGGNVRKTAQDFPGGPVLKTPHFYCRGGHGFDPWSGKSACRAVRQKKK